jgi:YidC/Oxa1 family membrane protein insertase
MKKKIIQSVLALWMLMLIAPSSSADTVVQTPVADHRLQWEFDLSAGTVKHWRLPGILNAQGEPQDLAAPAGKLFALKGALQGKSLDEWTALAGGWRQVGIDADAVVLELSGTALPFVLRKTWRQIDQPWRAGFELSMQSKGLKKLDGDSLWLEIGPGVGEVPTQGLGMGQAIYSFTELVYRADDVVRTLRLGNDEMSGFVAPAGLNVEWLGLQSRYFALVMIPRTSAERTLAWRAQVPETPVWYAQHPSFETALQIEIPIASDASTEPQVWRWDVYGGGKSYQALSAQDPSLSSVLFAGLWEWMRMLALGIMAVLGWIHHVVGSWGVSIILLAILVRLVMYPVAKNAMAAQKNFAAIQERIQPQLQEIRRNYKGGEQSERILELYEEHQVSPLAGLKPLLIVLIQIPIFVALYHLLGQAFDLRNEPFLWMQTLAQPDQLFSFGVDIPFFGAYFNLLPVLMALSTLLSIKFSPAPAANAKEAFKQHFFLWLMALGFFLLFYSFPSGMVLYWTMANILQFIHQRLVKLK